MEKTLLEKTCRIVNEIFLLTGDMPIKYDSEYDIFRIAIEYLLECPAGAGQNITMLKKMLIRELSSNRLQTLLKGMAPAGDEDGEASLIQAALDICRQREEYREALYKCIMRTERLELTGSSNEFTQNFEGLLARNLVRCEKYTPLPEHRMPVLIRLSNIIRFSPDCKT